MPEPDDSNPADDILSSVVLSRFQAEELIHAHDRGMDQLYMSLDLGISESLVELNEDQVIFRDDVRLYWDQIYAIHADENSCFLVQDDDFEKIIAFSEAFNRVYSLMPTRSAPTLLISGIPMHRIKGTDPHQDTLSKLRTVKPVHGSVLDTATGLGYTAIEAARSADHVITIEVDPEVLEIARLNPWSRSLFEHPKIERRIGDSFELVESFEEQSFDIVLHDPPTIALDGDLYGRAFYTQLHRILKEGGRLFHYIGNPESPSGRSTTPGVIQRLQEIGFLDIQRAPEAFGVRARK
jgi:predicted methyltransferase